jgi:NADP-dependent 3-hydroxy acid dehydrogenase YdfG
VPKIAVVTGASSGIGAASARRLAKDGYQVVLVARREDRLSALAVEIGGWVAVVDTTDPASVAGLAAALERCDVLVNNAGGAIGVESVATSDPADWTAMFNVNVLGTLRITQALLPLMRAAETATIVVVTSTAAYGTYEGGGGYCAAKHAEHALTQTLRLELCGLPIRVVEIVPGMVKTEEFSLNRFRGDAERAAAVYTNVDRPLSADDVAECISWAVGQPEHVNIDQLVVRPIVQASQHKMHRGPLLRLEPQTYPQS